MIEVREMNIKPLREQRGMAYPSMNTVIKMAELFQVSMDVVLGLAPIPGSSESA